MKKMLQLVYYFVFFVYLAAIGFSFSIDFSKSLRISNQFANVSNNFPFQVVIFTDFVFSQKEYTFQEGLGSILNDQWVITSGQNVYNNVPPHRVCLLLGAQLSFEQGFNYSVREIRIHPGSGQLHSSNNYKYDIALIRTHRRIEFSERIQPISLSTTQIGEDVRGTFGVWVNKVSVDWPVNYNT